MQPWVVLIFCRRHAAWISERLFPMAVAMGHHLSLLRSYQDKNGYAKYNNTILII
jgi:hypothetical protein